jgi:uncharacterized metal-binding protein YceD (DUF177 family)
MRFRLHKLVFGAVGATQREELDFSVTRFDDDLTVDYLRGDLKFVRLNDSIMLEGQLETELDVQCVRSLEYFKLCRVVEIADVFLSLPGAHTDDPLRKIDAECWIDLAETLREEIVMSLPINPVSPTYADAANDALPDGLDETDRSWLTIRWHNQDRGASEA